MLIYPRYVYAVISMERESNTHEIKINLVGFFFPILNIVYLFSCYFHFYFYSFFCCLFSNTICFVPCLALNNKAGAGIILSKEIWFRSFIGLNCVFVFKINFHFPSININEIIFREHFPQNKTIIFI